MTKKTLATSEKVTLFISGHIEEEAFFPELKKGNYAFRLFSHETGGWGDDDCPGIYILHEKFLLQNFGGLLYIFFKVPENRPVIVIAETISREYLASIFSERPYQYLPHPVSLADIEEAIREARVMGAKEKLIQKYEDQLRKAQGEIKDLHSVGMALSGERDPEKLLALILTKSREISGADAASFYLVESEKNLRFKLTQNISLDWQMSENRLIPIDEKSLAGYVAKTGEVLNLLDVYYIPTSYMFTFNRSFDEKSGYRTKSMVVVPMKNHVNEIIGVIQLINKRIDFETLVPGQKLIEENILPFSRNDLDLLLSLASQAAIAIENSKLYEDIKNLFEGFVKASIVAIEARDPTTCGHSERVAALTVAFARKVGEMKDGPFRDVVFGDVALTEIRYASLLHDFGKVGVREEILVKAKKLFPHELDVLKIRYFFIRKSFEADYYRNCFEYLREKGKSAFEIVQPAWEANFRSQLEELDEILNFLLGANEPTVLEEGNFQRLLEIAKRQYKSPFDGKSFDYLSQREMQVLSIRRGSLSEAERTEIESHVTHTFNFLSKIPWTRNLKRVPEIAYAHHEKLNGRGYPNHLDGRQIPVESKLMTICDIFDALTARDRPYKRAIPYEKAFDIMYNEVKQGLLPKDFLDLFVEAKIYKVIENFPTGRIG